MAAKQLSYILRDIDPQLWAKVKAKAHEQDRTLKSFILRALQVAVATKTDKTS